MFGRIGIWELLLILGIVILIFGTKKLRNLGGDLGSALRNFKSSMREGEKETDQQTGQDKIAANDRQDKP